MANKRAYEYGQQLGIFTIVKPASEMTDEDKASAKGVKPGARGWLLKCQCGTLILAEPARVNRGFLQSCGCLKGANISKNRDHVSMGKAIKLAYALKSQEEKDVERAKNSKRQYKFWQQVDKEAVLEKRKQAFKVKHGVENAFQLDSVVKNKQDEGIVYTIKETGESLRSWFDKSNPEFSYQHIRRECERLNTKEIPLSFLKEVLQNYKQSISTLESNFSKLSGLPVRPFKQVSKDIKYRFDFEVSKELYINVDGLYWHTEENTQTADYHSKMREVAEKVGVRLIQFREDEVYHKTEIIKSILNNVRGLTTNTVFARKCEIRSISHKEASRFFSRTHLMGPHSSSKAVGLYYENKLVSCMAYKVQKGNKMDISRFSSELNTKVVGGLSKLLKYLEKTNLHVKTIEYWVDLRYGTGTKLLDLGFTKERDSLGYWYTDYKKVYHRLTGARMLERDPSLKLYKIWDACQRLYVKKVND